VRGYDPGNGRQLFLFAGVRGLANLVLRPVIGGAVS
jgi:hypothetical protein